MMGAREREMLYIVDDQEVLVPRKRTRKTRNGGISQETKEKFKNMSQKNHKLEPLNDKQADYIEAILNTSFTICIGVWGSSKTYIPSVIASDLLLDKKIAKIIIARPAEGKGKSVGFLKGDKNEKLQPWCAPVVDTIKQRVGAGDFDAFVANGKIELLALEHVKGRSWDDCFVIVDEAEDLDPEVAKSLVGRQGMNTKMVITGDIRQQDLKKNSGLEYLLEVAKYSGIPISLIDFDSWDYCVRSKEAKMWGKAFEDFSNRQHK